jgi:wyosine [tRNA(Phe)-imidazoG37] synthetase (radical SAM superfamily)
VAALEAEFASFFGGRREAEFPGTPVRDICLSGSGEPSLSPHLESALYAIAAARRRYCPEAENVIITNATGFLTTPVFDVIERFARKTPLAVWAKLDAGTEEWFRAMNGGGAHSLADIVSGIERFAVLHPLVVQTMVCSVGGRIPGPEEWDAYAARIGGLLEGGADLAGIQLYTQARPAPLGITGPVPERLLMDIALRVREITQGRVPVRTYGSR